jgi:nucleotide-binding universal stress UspA family protein
MSTSIVVGTDGSDSAKLAVEQAARLAKDSAAELHIVSAFMPLRGAMIAGAAMGAAMVWAPLPDSYVEATLSEAAAAAKTHGVEVTTYALEQDAADALIDVAEGTQASIIVVGSKGMHGVKRFKLGNVPNRISHKARCSVLIVATD